MGSKAVEIHPDILPYRAKMVGALEAHANEATARDFHDGPGGPPSTPWTVEVPIHGKGINLPGRKNIRLVKEMAAFALAATLSPGILQMPAFGIPLIEYGTVVICSDPGSLTSFADGDDKAALSPRDGRNSIEDFEPTVRNDGSLIDVADE
ncbi:hypothetical protein [Microvirga terrestris]|uniref:Uncharacterized protein n=1 Tax=Microvirga terrestris TaxID=2791024 RepID=A0ABS0HN43_9HYPH|nr:hypothetical protein [Microvirga terrestris]MBF9194799.1 hypothetical protein [Microvirga terrestris]